MISCWLFQLLMVYAQKEGLRLWDVFAQFDKDGSMSISKDEFKHAIKVTKVLGHLSVSENVKI